MSSIDHTQRIGAFADGQTSAPGAIATTGRFCTGQEQRPDAGDRRIGRFADGQAQRTEANPIRGRFSSGQDAVAQRRAGRAIPSGAPLPAFAEGDG